jgi:hypothetical protein
MEMLKFLVELAEECGIGANVTAFAERFPITQHTKDELDVLKKMGYITPEYCDNKLSIILVQQKAHDYFR